MMYLIICCIACLSKLVILIKHKKAENLQLLQPKQQVLKLLATMTWSKISVDLVSTF